MNHLQEIGYMTRTTSATGRAMLVSREGVELNAYRDTKGVITIGCGHTGPGVHDHMTITAAEADRLLAADLAPCERVVNAADIHGILSQNAFDACVSLAFNIGVHGFSTSSVARYIALRDLPGAARAFMLWDKPPELVGRRKGERDQFLTPDRAPIPREPPITVTAKPKPVKTVAGAAVVVAGTTAVVVHQANPGHPLVWILAGIAVLAVAVALVFHFRKDKP